MKYVAVLPYAYRPFYDECKKTLKLDFYPIDNTISNRGVAESWNLGIDRMREQDADWLIIVSSSMRFGEAGGMDVLPALEGRLASKLDLVFFARPKPLAGPLPHVGFGYHFAAISRELAECQGYFDTNFYPIYFEDADYNLRLRKSGLHYVTLCVADAETVGYNKAITEGGVISPAEPLITYFATKWGIHPDAVGTLEPYEHPFNNPDYSLEFFPPAHGRTWQ